MVGQGLGRHPQSGSQIAGADFSFLQLQKDIAAVFIGQGGQHFMDGQRLHFPTV